MGTKEIVEDMPDNNFTISYCIPCMNRTHHLKKVMPSIIEAANYSPPVEILVLDYNSTDDIDEYMASLRSVQLAEGNDITYLKYSKNKYYHMAHARNMVSLAARGKYLVETCVEVYLGKHFFSNIREEINRSKYKWLRFYSKKPSGIYAGIIVIEKEEFIEAGGYDERFELYGPEDRELNSRLERRGIKSRTINSTYLHPYTSSDEEKTKNYRLKLTKRQMVEKMIPYYEESVKNKALEVNRGVKWGQH